MVRKQIKDQDPKGNQEIQIGGWDWETQNQDLIQEIQIEGQGQGLIQWGNDKSRRPENTNTNLKKGFDDSLNFSKKNKKNLYWKVNLVLILTLSNKRSFSKMK